MHLKLMRSYNFSSAIHQNLCLLVLNFVILSKFAEISELVPAKNSYIKVYSTCNLCIAELLIDVTIKTRKLITVNKTQNISAVALLVLYNKSSYCGSLCDKHGENASDI